MSTRQIPAPWERVYDIHGVRVALRTNSPAVAAGAEQALAHFAWLGALHPPQNTAGGDPPLRMDLRGTDVPAAVPPEAQPQFRHAQMRCYRRGEELWYANTRATVVLNPHRGTAEGTVAAPLPFGRGCADAESGPLNLRSDAVFTFSLLELLRHRGLYHLHAAGLTRNAAGVLLAGDTGAGKSTLTVTLLRAGWDFLSDDTVLLRDRPGGVEALAVPNDFHLDPALAHRFPELGLGVRKTEGDEPRRHGEEDIEYSSPCPPCLRGSSIPASHKARFRPEEVYNREAVSACVPSLLLFPQIAPGTTRAVALTPTQALAALIRASALVLLDERVAAPHLDSLRRLVSQCRCYWLYHGPDALEDPNCVPELVEALVGAA